MVARRLMSLAVAAILLTGAVPPAMADATVAGQTLIQDFNINPETLCSFAQPSLALMGCLD